jgi:iron complex outermembrane receptor protein
MAVTITKSPNCHAVGNQVITLDTSKVEGGKSAATGETIVNKSRLALHTMAVGMLAPSIVVAPAAAQQTAASDQSDTAPRQDDASADDGTGLSAIVVTAQRRSERLQDIPIAVNAPSGELLQQTGVIDTRALAILVPNLEVGYVNQSATLFLRGVGTQNTLPGVEPSVATYVDGVYFPSPAGALFHYNNIDRIEVLKGPQGTLFGRNATGGVIHVITKNPGDEVEFNGSVGYDNLETLEINAYGATPITENLAADLAVYFRDQGEGYGVNGNTGDDVMYVDTLSVRSKWRLDLGQTTATAIFNYVETQTDLGAYRVPFENTVLFSGQRNRGFYTSFTNVPEPDAETETLNGSFELRHQMGDVELVSITAYTDLTSSFIAIADGSAAAAVQLPVEVHSKTFTQELQLIGSTDNLEWIVGGFYFDDDTSADRFETIIRAGTLTTADLVAQQKTQSLAGFGQVTFAATDRFKLTAGLRYTKDWRQYQATQRNFVPGTSVPNDLSTYTLIAVDRDASEGQLTWRLAAAYDFSPDVLGYVSWNRGFKSGQFTINEPTNDPVEAETIDAFEIGLKSELFGNRLRLNIAAFYYDYRDIQAQQVIEIAPITVNAGDAEIYGLDVDLEARLTRDLTLFGGLGLLEGEYRDFENAIGFLPNVAPGQITGPPGAVPGSGNRSVIVDASGNSITSAPDVTLNLGLRYRRETPLGEFGATAVYNHRSEAFYNFNNSVAAGPFDIVNASIDWTAPGGRFGATLWAENLFDEQYVLRVESLPFGNFATPARPLTYGIRLRVNF